MKHIQNIDEAIKITRSSRNGWVVAKTEEGSGILKWKIRAIKSLAVLFGKADAFTYSE